jgi:uncharacterized OsmC-like protein
MTQAQSTVLNGLDTSAMAATVRAIKDEPVIAKFQFRAQNEWLGGGHNRTTIADFDGACQRHVHDSPHVVDSDEPPVLLSADRAANPAQHALHALAACLCSTVVIHATARGIPLRSVESTLEGDVDVRGVLGLDDTVRNGYSGIRVGLKVDADAPSEVIDELVKAAQARSPLVDIVSNPTPLTVYRVR